MNLVQMSRSVRDQALAALALRQDHRATSQLGLPHGAEMKGGRVLTAEPVQHGRGRGSTA
jgi:hypothetical protein